jgi:hypothetical protein
MNEHEVSTEFNPPEYAVPSGWQILDALRQVDSWPPVDGSSRARILERFGSLPHDLPGLWAESLHKAAEILERAFCPEIIARRSAHRAQLMERLEEESDSD